MWNIVTALKVERNYLIRENMLLKTDYLSILNIIFKYSTLDISMLRWIVFIRFLNPVLIHIKVKENMVANMLSRARYMNREEIIT